LDRIYDAATSELLVSQSFTDATCTGGRHNWVVVPLEYPFRPEAKTEYLIVIDGLTYYTKNEGYFPGSAVSRHIVSLLKKPVDEDRRR
jgi:hypothetical protein